VTTGDCLVRTPDDGQCRMGVAGPGSISMPMFCELVPLPSSKMASAISSLVS